MKKKYTFIISTISTLLASLLFTMPAWSKLPLKTKKISKISITKTAKVTKKVNTIKKVKLANPIKIIIPIVPVFVEQTQDVQQIARWVVSGQYQCFGQKTITLTPRTDYPGYVDVQQNGKTYLFLATASNTGAVRLESKAANLFWLQLSVKSMLFNSQIGSRILDDCQPKIPPSISDIPVTALKSKASLLTTDMPILPINSSSDAVLPAVATPITGIETIPTIKIAP